ncbi:hypothetical protein QR680_016982 [Steinernema hermaphroditum]|uniref:RanBP2-type domain-containing protein n=1 Tax=Steinernema hermaphroditum TaxID=289476 RepID=A0AA39HCW8_9BILA|nr:hypothetical protein QR680_016982 [Steinernema hermaphroditum]
MTRTDASRFLADFQEMQERNNRNLTQMMGDIAEQLAQLRLSQERISQELTMLQSSVKTAAVVEESKLWRQWAQASINAQANAQKEQMDRMLTMFSMMGIAGAPAQQPQVPMNMQHQAMLMQQRLIQQAQEQQAAQYLMQMQAQAQAAATPVVPQAPAVTTTHVAPQAVAVTATPVARQAVAVTATPAVPQVTAVTQAASPLTSVAAPAQPVKTEEKPKGWGDAWKPKPGSWECKGCYIRNQADVSTCPSCGTNKDGSSGKPDPFAKTAAATKPVTGPSSGGFSFGLSAPKEATPAPAKQEATPTPAATTEKPTEPAKPSFAFKSFGSSATTATTPAPAPTSAPAPTKPLFNFTPSSTPSSTATATTAASQIPVCKPNFSFTAASANTSSTSAATPVSFSFTTTTAAASSPADTSASETKVFGGFGSGQKVSFQSVTSGAADIFAGKQSSTSSFGDPKAFKFGQTKTDAVKTDNPSTSKPDNDNEDADEEYEPDAHFEPVIPLPSLVEVKTGEEEEEVLFSERARLYRYVAETKEYKERGTGEIKVLRHPATNRYRVVMRREQVLKLCANFSLLPGMKVTARSDGKPTCMFSAMDFAEDSSGEQLTLTVRFRTEESRNTFLQLFEKGVEAAAVRQSQTDDVAKQVSEEAVEDEDDRKVFELEVTATLTEAYPSPLRPAKGSKNTRMRLECLYEELHGVGPVYRIYFYNTTTQKLEFSHFIRDEINLTDREEGVSYTATNPDGVTYRIDITFDSAEDDDVFRDNFHDGVVLIEGDYEGEEDYEYEDYEEAEEDE